MRKYAIVGSQNVANPTDTLLGLTGAVTIRPEIVHAILGSLATPADNALQFLFQRYTAPGTAAAVTPRALDPGDPAALASAGQNHTVEPTYTAGEILLDIPLNQKASFPWYANDGFELKLPATANNGIGVQPVHGTFTGLVNGTIHFQE